MAKGNFLTQVVRGKLGNMVGYNVANTNDKVKQGWRGYTAKIANPRTSGQAAQRMKMAVITRFYQNLAPIIRRGFENVPYGAKSYQKFLSVNLANMNGPYVEKGRRTLVPGEFVITDGSLQPVTITDLAEATIAGKAHVKLLGCSLNYDDFWGTSSYYGEWCDGLIYSNPWLKDGDQLTFVNVMQTENLDYIYSYRSIVLDVNSDVRLEILPEASGSSNNAAVQIGSNLLITPSSVTGSIQLQFCVTNEFTIGDEIPVAGAVIVSRQKDDASGWLRSPSKMWVNMNDTDIAQYWWPEYYQIALASYMSADAGSVDWPTDPADSPTTDGLVMVPVKATVGETSLDIQVLGLQRDGETLILFRTVDGQRRPLWTDSKPYWMVISGQRHELLLSEITPNRPATQYYSSYGTL